MHLRKTIHIKESHEYNVIDLKYVKKLFRHNKGITLYGW